MWKWLSGILAMVTSGIIIWWITVGPSPEIRQNHVEAVDKHGFNNSASSKYDVEWTSVKTYFSIKKINIKKGFGKADSQLRFLLTAKGTFGGRLHLYAFDRDGVRICPLILPSHGCISYNFGVRFDNNPNNMLGLYRKTDHNFRFWQEGEADWATVFLPRNVNRLQFSFSQKY